MSRLKQQSISGVFWAITEKFGVTGVKLIFGIILARLLTPAEFGIIGMIIVFIEVAQVFVESGLGMAYVQKKEINNKDADTVFLSNLIISIVIFIIIFVCAPVIAGFYNQPDLIILVRVMAVAIIINAFNIIQLAQIKRSVNFKKLTKVTLTSSLLSGTIGTIAAFKGMGVWALVLQSLCNRTFIGIGLWFTSDYRPRLSFSKHSFVEMFSFGAWVLFSSLITTVFNNIYLLAIGKFFPIAQLGFYTKSKQLAEMPTNQIAQAIGNVAFPVYASIQNDTERLRNAMKRFIQPTMLFNVLLIAILVIVAKPLVVLLLTEKWLPMVPYFQVICITAILYPLNQINAQSLIALGKSKLSFNLTLARNTLRLINIFVTYRFGVIYMLLGELIIAVIFFFINAWSIQKYTNYGPYRQIRDIWKIILGGIIAGAASMSIISFIDNLVIWLVSGIFFTGMVYLLLEYLINRELIDSTREIIESTKTSKNLTQYDG